MAKSNYADDLIDDMNEALVQGETTNIELLAAFEAHIDALLEFGMDEGLDDIHRAGRADLIRALESLQASRLAMQAALEQRQQEEAEGDRQQEAAAGRTIEICGMRYHLDHMSESGRCQRLLLEDIKKLLDYERSAEVCSGCGELPAACGCSDEEIEAAAEEIE